MKETPLKGKEDRKEDETERRPFSCLFAQQVPTSGGVASGCFSRAHWGSGSGSASEAGAVGRGSGARCGGGGWGLVVRDPGAGLGS